MNEIKNITDQMRAFSGEIRENINYLIESGSTKEEAIKITELALKSMKVETLWNRLENLDDIAASIYALNEKL